jgi:sugar/nucleoside kinase (ribokinase family)
MSVTHIVDCVIIGDIFIDINVKFNGDIIRGGITDCEEIKCVPAGISNIATALSILGCSTAVIGKCGQDIFGNIFISDIKNYNNILSYIFTDSYLSTGLLISLIDSSAERSFITARGANNTLTPDEIDPILRTLCYKYLYTTGYSLSYSPQCDAIIHSMQLAKRSSAITIFDAGAYNIITKNIRYFKTALELTDILSCNLEEARVISNESNIRDIISKLTEIIKIVIIRLGKDGCIVCNNKETKYISIPLKINAIDTTGAGDAFNSALIYGLINGWNLYKAAYFANLFAAQKVTKLGARSFPSKDEINLLLQLINNNKMITNG